MAYYRFHPPCLLLSFIVTFLAIQTQLAESQESSISFVQEPKENYYIVKKKPVTIVCATKHAVDITFTCGGTQVPASSVEREDSPEMDEVKTSVVITRADISNYKDSQENFWCECNAIGYDGQIAATSRRANISIAVLKYKFQLHPASQKVNEGEDVEFQCRHPVSNPKPEVFWVKDKKRIHFGQNPRVSLSPEGNLQIEAVTEADVGSYQCVAKSPAGKRFSKPADLSVVVLAESAEPEEEVSREAEGGGKSRQERESEKPYFSTEPKALYYIKPDEPLSIDCGITSANIITFRCNGARMERKRQTTNQGQHANGNRIIQSSIKIVYDDIVEFHRRNGNRTSYQCQCVGWYQTPGANKWKTIFSNKRLGVVKLAYLESNFMKEPSDLIAGVGMKAKLVCEPPKGQPSPWVYWYKDDVKLDPRTNARYQVSRKGHLTISSAELSDTGRYKCVAENTVKQVESKVAELRITEEAPPSTTPTTTMGTTELVIPEQIEGGFTFVQDLPEKTVINEQGVAKLKCVTLGARMLTIDCNGRRLSQDEFTIHRELHPQTKKNIITVTTEVGAGDVQASADGYSCRCTAWELDGQKWKQHYGTAGYVVEEKKTYIKEEFVYPPEDTEAYFEDAAELACEPPEGYPSPTVSWMKDGELIKPEEDSNYVVLEAGTLVLEYVREKDQGSYVCVAENEAGSVQSDPAKLTVMGLPTTPSVVETTTETTPELTTTEATTTPQPEPSSTKAMYSTTTFDYDDSTYGGELEPFFTLEPEPVNYITSKGGSVTLSCTVIAAKSLMFACNGKTLKNTATTGFVTTDELSGHDVRENSFTVTDKDLMEHEGSDPYSCICKGYAQYEDTGEWYSVDSRAGTVQMAYLEREFMKEPESTAVAMGEEVTLMCSPPEGVPKPEVNWIKDGFLLVTSDNVMIKEDASLFIKSFTESDVGEYTCSAQNLMGQRSSPTIQLSVRTTDQVEPEPEPEPETTPKMMSTENPSIETVTVTEADGSTHISKDLHSVYYVTKNKPATLICEAVDASHITFSCGTSESVNEMNVVQSTGNKEIVTKDGMTKVVDLAQGEITVSKSDLGDYVSGEYSCVCRAHYQDEETGKAGFMESQVGYVEAAFLKKRFLQEPQNTRATEGEFLSIPCVPPNGNPQPEVSWLKDGEPFERLNLAPDSALIFESVKREDAGEYICVAKNAANKRMSAPILVEVLGGSKVIATDSTETVEDMSKSTTEDSVIEVVEITSVPLTSDSTNEQSETNTDDFTTEAPVPEMSESTTMYMEKYTDDMVDEETTPTAEPSYSEETTYNNVSELPEGEKVEMITRKKICEGLNSKCKGLKPMDREIDLQQDCLGPNSYMGCMAELMSKCSNALSYEEIEEARSDVEQLQEQCKQFNQCPELNECKHVYYERVEDKYAESGLPLHLFCRDIQHFSRCANNAMSNCGLPMTEPKMGMSSSQDQINSWFEEYCYLFVMDEPSLESCRAMTECNLPVAVATKDNSTYWCSLVDTLYECTKSSVTSCELQELNNSLETINQLRQETSCQTMDEEEEEYEGEGTTGATMSESARGKASCVTMSIFVITFFQLVAALSFTHIR